MVMFFIRIKYYFTYYYINPIGHCNACAFI